LGTLLCAALPAWCAAPLVDISDIPALPDGPGKGHYALFQGKLFEVLMTTNLGLSIYPVEGGKRVGPPIEIANCNANPSEKLRVVSIVKPAPPALNPARLSFDFVSDSGIHVLQTWKLRDGSLLVDNQVNNFPSERIPQLLIAVRFPRTHAVSTNAPQSERIKATGGCTLRWRGGEGDEGLKVYTAPYANRVDLLGFCDWIEHKGPWGNRKLTLRRTSAKGYFQPLGVKFAYEGLGLMFISRPDGKRKIEGQGFELKIE
jgi:hypothetical protein